LIATWKNYFGNVGTPEDKNNASGARIEGKNNEVEVILGGLS